MKKSEKGNVLRPPFEEVLQRVFNDEGDFFGDFPDSSEFRAWIINFAEQAYDVLERLYVKHRVPPAEPLEAISGGIYFQASRSPEIPKLLTNPGLREKSAAAMEQVAADLESCDPLFFTPKLWSSPEFREKLREYAKALRATSMRPMAHRPPDVIFNDCACMLTDIFRKYAGKPLWDYSGRLLELALNRHVADMKDSIKKVVRRARQEE